MMVALVAAQLTTYLQVDQEIHLLLVLHKVIMVAIELGIKLLAVVALVRPAATLLTRVAAVMVVMVLTNHQPLELVME
jgi:hypothetical protein